MIRAGSLNDPSRSVISIALMARSAAQIIFAYEKMYRTGKQNLPWPQVRRTCTAAEIILLAYSRYELDRREAGNLMTIALGLMRTQGVRWKSAAEVRGCLIQLSEALSGLMCGRDKSSASLFIRSPHQAFPSKSVVTSTKPRRAPPYN